MIQQTYNTHAGQKSNNLLQIPPTYAIIHLKYDLERKQAMKHIKTVNKANLKETAAKGGCGKCQTSCQSACKTSCTVANQTCEANK